MADTKISALTDGTTAEATDKIPVERSGANRYITPGYIKTAIVTGGTVTTSTPVLDMTQTWNAGAVTFTGFKFNVTDTASASGSLLFQLQVGGADRALITKGGRATFGIAELGDDGYVSLFETVATAMARTTTARSWIINTGDNPQLFTRAAAVIGWTASASNADVGTTPDLILRRNAAANLALGAADAASPVAQTISVQNVAAGTTNTAGANLTIAGSRGTGTGVGGSILFQTAAAGTTGTAQNSLATVLEVRGNGGITGQDGATANTVAIRNGATAQTFRVYNTHTDASNYERGFIQYNSNVLEIGHEAAGTGSQRILRFTSAVTGAGTAWEFRSSGSTGPRLVLAGTDRSVTLSPESNMLTVQAGGFLSLLNYATGASGGTFALRSRNGSNTTNFFGLSGVDAGIMQINNGSGRGDGYGASLEMWEMTAPSAPATNGVRIYAEDNGSGKTRLMALFPTGAAQQIAIEP